jgi:N-acylneuraminate cytidylyltransferase
LKQPLIVIPGRSGSKGIPKKNIKILGDKPLIMHTVQAARNVFEDNSIIVSTDDMQIKNFVEKRGLAVPFLRPTDLASDTAGIYGVLLHALDFTRKHRFDPDIVVLLQPTSPFRTEKHIMEAMEIYSVEEDIDMVVSVAVTKANPYYVLFEDNDEGFLEHSKKGSFARRQDCPKVWQYTGAIYVINVTSLERSDLSRFKKVKKYVMDEESSHDLDTPLDWMLAEAILKKRGHNI